MAPIKRTRILCVDDEMNILEGLKLHLGRNFDMTTALTGEEALELMSSEGPFAVVVTDMRMPSMNGIQFLQAAKPLSPDTTFIMLTGNHDLETATKAVNEGHVFRFLNKPCPSNILKIAIDDGIERFNLLKEKREVLNDTFVGSIRLMTDILEMSHPATFSRAHAVEQMAMKLTNMLGIEERWEMKLATRLSRIGVAVLASDAPTDPQHESQSWSWESEAGQHLVKLIPRLRFVSEIIGKWGSANGVFPTVVTTDEEAVAAGSSIIRASWIVEQLFRNGMSAAAAAAELHKQMPQASERLIEAVKKLEPPASLNVAPEKIQEVGLKELKEGMILAKPFETGNLKLSMGHRITQAMILRLSYLLRSEPQAKLHVIGK